MGSHFLAGVCLLGTALLAGCWVKEATPEKNQSLIIVSDLLSSEDSLLVRDFSRKFDVKVKMVVLSPEVIVDRVKNGRYNAETDLFITENKALRESLYDLKAWKYLSDETLFSGIKRQFANKHHLWVPLSHDPLLFTFPSDTNGVCHPINFKTWHRGKGKDSIQPMIRLKSNQAEYAIHLAKTKHLKWLNVVKPANYWSTERIYSLSGFINTFNQKDSTFKVTGQQSCRLYLTDSGRYVTRTLAIGIYEFHRNTEAAEHFIRYYIANSYRVARGRNQLPVRRNVSIPWKIQAAEIR